MPKSDSYFELRNVGHGAYEGRRLPAYLKSALMLAVEKHQRVMDFGCGYGQILDALLDEGYTNIFGVDVDAKALSYTSKGHRTIDASNVDWWANLIGSNDLVIMSHVLEHIPKKEMIPQLMLIKSLLKASGKLIIMVPNAQSNTGCYWAYEDFTHEYLFTAGSLYYVLKAAGFASVEFLDVDCTAGLRTIQRFNKKGMLWLYRRRQSFWNRVTSSAFHAPSPQIFSYEIKAIATL
jgi:cyclopropane fatty-acyl-phospholipid synthase-like methyltransferase